MSSKKPKPTTFTLTDPQGRVLSIIKVDPAGKRHNERQALSDQMRLENRGGLKQTQVVRLKAVFSTKRALPTTYEEDYRDMEVRLNAQAEIANAWANEFANLEPARVMRRAKKEMEERSDGDARVGM